ncbi:hypothetical protein [Aureimonas sp. Leaf324]|jgi:hypothetical protein|uniref:hypothetical protein n=1 Tax=Aureimonas sp. Leaf324 TaxID=1736336 RepID=UPI0006FC4F54|nr:hypothetical protein [Aureimonas sp. Leaf324]KQQ81265.1 hypothetical protein ASF65_09700 [Aureimonas sp. Leaf324]
MFLEYRNWRPPEPIKPTPRLSKRGERVLLWVLGVNFAMLLFGPLAGTSVFQGLWALVFG